MIKRTQRTNLVCSGIIKAEKLQHLWQELEHPLVIHFNNPKSTLSAQVSTQIAHAAEKLMGHEITFLDLEVEEDLVEFLIDEYQVHRFPTIIIYDFGKEIDRLDDVRTIREQLDIRIAKCLTT